MKAKIFNKNARKFMIEVETELEEGMLDTEESIQKAVNYAKLLAKEYAFAEFDANGSPIEVTDTPAKAE